MRIKEQVQRWEDERKSNLRKGIKDKMSKESKIWKWKGKQCVGNKRCKKVKKRSKT